MTTFSLLAFLVPFLGIMIISYGYVYVMKKRGKNVHTSRNLLTIILIMLTIGILLKTFISNGYQINYQVILLAAICLSILTRMFYNRSKQ